MLLGALGVECEAHTTICAELLYLSHKSAHVCIISMFFCGLMISKCVTSVIHVHAYINTAALQRII